MWLFYAGNFSILDHFSLLTFFLLRFLLLSKWIECLSTGVWVTMNATRECDWKFNKSAISRQQVQILIGKRVNFSVKLSIDICIRDWKEWWRFNSWWYHRSDIIVVFLIFDRTYRPALSSIHWCSRWRVSCNNNNLHAFR